MLRPKKKTEKVESKKQAGTNVKHNHVGVYHPIRTYTAGLSRSSYPKIPVFVSSTFGTYSATLLPRSLPFAGKESFHHVWRGSRVRWIPRIRCAGGTRGEIAVCILQD